jgi:transcriptional regulator with XRE-family HTH domain
MSGRGPSATRTKADTPLSELRLRAGLSIPELARRFNVTTATVSRWCSGEREAPASFVLFLQAAAAGDAAATAKQQADFAETRRRERRATGPTFRFEHRLPPDVTPDDARRACVDALGRLAGGAR